MCVRGGSVISRATGVKRRREGGQGVRPYDEGAYPPCSAAAIEARAPPGQDGGVSDINGFHSLSEDAGAPAGNRQADREPGVDDDLRVEIQLVQVHHRDVGEVGQRP